MASGPSPDVAIFESRRHEFQCLGPVLLVVPDDMLALWEGEFAFWAGAPPVPVMHSVAQSSCCRCELALAVRWHCQSQTPPCVCIYGAHVGFICANWTAYCNLMQP